MRKILTIVSVICILTMLITSCTKKEENITQNTETTEVIVYHFSKGTEKATSEKVKANNEVPDLTDTGEVACKLMGLKKIKNIKNVHSSNNDVYIDLYPESLILQQKDADKEFAILDALVHTFRNMGLDKVYITVEGEPYRTSNLTLEIGVPYEPKTESVVS